MGAHGLEARIAALIAEEALPTAYADTVRAHWMPLAANLAARRAAAGRPLLIGINGPQGSGKSSLCRFVEMLLQEAHGLRAATLSLDDVYLTRAAREALGRDVHPLLRTRGVPGTHDLPLAEAVITAALSGAGEVALPRFDKAADDRRPEADWPHITAPLDILLFEGWCMGAEPMPETGLAAPINSLEAEEDPDGRWRQAINTALNTGYRQLFARLDALVFLEAPGFAPVLAWRTQQEHKLRARSGPAAGPAAAGMDDAAIARFVAHYERLTRHMLATLPGRADIVMKLDEQRRIGAIVGLA